jgi:hypothetical protein
VSRTVPMKLIALSFAAFARRVVFDQWKPCQQMVRRRSCARCEDLQEWIRRFPATGDTAKIQSAETFQRRSTDGGGYKLMLLPYDRVV